MRPDWDGGNPRPQPPISKIMGFHLTEADIGRAVFEGVPDLGHYNPIGSVHGGFAATLLDSAVACAVQTTLKKGELYTTLEIKINLVRALTKDVGLLSQLVHDLNAGSILLGPAQNFVAELDRASSGAQ